MRKRVLWVAALTLWIGCLVVVAADEGGLGFGFGGGGVSAFFPELESVNAYLSENGLAPMPSFLVGGVGGGRGGMIGGVSLGGMGFGAAGTSIGLDRSGRAGGRWRRIRPRSGRGRGCDVGSHPRRRAGRRRIGARAVL